MQINILLPEQIGFFILKRSLFTQTPEFIRKVAVGELMTEDISFARKVGRSMDVGSKLFLQGVQSQHLCVKGPGDGILAIKAKRKRVHYPY